MKYSATFATTYIYRDDFPGQTLDQAIHNDTVRDGDTIIVRNGIYYEHLNVSKSITLEGGLQGPTILDGGGTGTVVTISAGNVMLIDFTIRNGVCGIKIIGQGNNVLKDNTVTSNSECGICIVSSNNNTLRHNTMISNYRNFGVFSAIELFDFIQDVDPSNTVDGKRIYYWVNKHNDSITAGDDAGYVAVVNSTNIIVKNLSLRKNIQGILLAYTTNSTIESNTASYNEYGGIELFYSDHNVIRNNTMIGNGCGIILQNVSDNIIVYDTVETCYYGISVMYSNNNTIYRNNFINNANQIPLPIGTNFWDNGREGNYWSDYIDADLNKDGIGDTHYKGIDYYPLMEPWSVKKIFTVIRYGEEYYITTISNSTIARASVDWNRESKTISFNITSGTAESINLTISRDWLEGPFEVKLNGTQIEPSNLKISQDAKNSYFFFNYIPAKYMVVIIGTRVLGYRNGDVNNDGHVNILDCIILSGHFGKTDS